MQPPDRKQKYLSSFAVAKELGISVAQVRELCKWGKLPKAHQKYKNGPWLIPHDSVVNFQKNTNNNFPPTLWDKTKHILFGTKIRSFLSSLGIILGLLFGAISAGSDIGWVNEQLTSWGIIKAIPVASGDETLIVIAEFYRTEGVTDTGIHEEIKRSIQETAAELGITNLRVELLPFSLRSNEISRAGKISNRYGAMMVIWGEDSGVRITVDYLALKYPKASPSIGNLTETDRTQLADPQGYSQIIINDLPAQLTFLALFANGQIAFAKGKTEEAIKIIKDAVSLLDSIGISREGVSAIYWTLATLYNTGYTQDIVVGQPVELHTPTPEELETGSSTPLPSKEDLEQAIKYFNLVVKLEPNVYTENGIVYLNRGIAWSMYGEWDYALSDLISFYKILHLNGPDPLLSAHWARYVSALTEKNYDIAISDIQYLIDNGWALNCQLAYDLMEAHYYRAYNAITRRDTPDTITTFMSTITNDPKYFIGRPDGELYHIDNEGTQVINANNVIGEFTKVIQLSSYCNENPYTHSNIDLKSTYFLRGQMYWMISEDENAEADYKRYVELEDADGVAAYYDYYMKNSDLLRPQDTP